jgi:hypothetical protein
MKPRLRIKNASLEDSLPLDARQLDLVRPSRVALLAACLQGDDVVDEDGISPRLGDTFGLLKRNDVRRGLFDNPEAIALQLAKHCRFARPRRAGQDVSLHCRLTHGGAPLGQFLLFSQSRRRIAQSPTLGLVFRAERPTTDFLGTGAGPMAFAAAAGSSLIAPSLEPRAKRMESRRFFCAYFGLFVRNKVKSQSQE